jgi:hypothetical protein
MNYEKAKVYAAQKNETNDCTVKAVSIVCDVPYHVAHKALALQGRVNRRGAYPNQIEKAIESLGFKFAHLVYVKAATCATLARDPAVYKGFFVAYVKRHILAVVDGKIEDWTATSCRRRLEGVYKVVPAVSRKERAERKAKIMQG